MSTIHLQMETLKTRASGCTDCGLSETRANVVFGSGDAEAKLAIVAEGPSAADNQTTFPFSGPAGELLDEVLAANGLTRAEYLADEHHQMPRSGHERRCPEKPPAEIGRNQGVCQMA